MVCYTVPTIATIVHFFMRRKISKFRTSKYQLWLNQLFLGGAIFGVVDHLWNREFFLFRGLSDVLLGITITLIIILIWTVMVLVDKNSAKASAKAEN